MVWGVQQGVGDIIERVQANDPKLTALCLFKQRRFGERDAEELCRALEGNTVLRELTITAHALTPAAVAAFASMLAANQHLHSLDLGNSCFGDEGLTALAPGIAASTSLRHLNLESKGITSAGCAALAGPLAASASLEELLLGHNAIGGTGLAALLGGLAPARTASGGPRLRALDLSACGLEGSDAVQVLADALEAAQLPRLQRLCLDDNALGAEGAAALAPALAAALSLRQLQLARCGLGGAGAAALAAALPPALRELELSGNAIGEQGAKALAEAFIFGAAPHLQRLSLAGCSLQAADIDALAAGLKHAAAEGGALHLDLSGNAAVSPAALAALGTAPLAGLCLHDCKLGSGDGDGGADGSAALQQFVAGSSFQALEELDLSGNGLSAEALCQLLAALAEGGGVVGASAAKGGPRAMARLRLLVLAANPGATEERVQGAMEVLQGVRPGLDVVRRAADSGEADGTPWRH